jgi:hypothetical protein
MNSCAAIYFIKIMVHPGHTLTPLNSTGAYVYCQFNLQPSRLVSVCVCVCSFKWRARTLQLCWIIPGIKVARRSFTWQPAAAAAAAIPPCLPSDRSAVVLHPARPGLLSRAPFSERISHVHTFLMRELNVCAARFCFTYNSQHLTLRAEIFLQMLASFPRVSFSYFFHCSVNAREVAVHFNVQRTKKFQSR